MKQNYRMSQSPTRNPRLKAFAAFLFAVLAGPGGPSLAAVPGESPALAAPNSIAATPPEPVDEAQAVNSEGTSFASGLVLDLSADQIGLLQFGDHSADHQVIVYGYGAATEMPDGPPLATGDNVAVKFHTATGEQRLAIRVQRLPADEIAASDLTAREEVAAVVPDWIVLQPFVGTQQSRVETLLEFSVEGSLLEALIPSEIDAGEASPLAGGAEKDADPFAFGKVVGISGAELTLWEFDFARDTDVEVVYQMLPETETANISAECPLKIGDDVVVDYQNRGGQRLATTLVRSEPADNAELENSELEPWPNADVSPVTDDDRFSCGKVSGITWGCIQVQEYDFETDTDVEVTYQLRPETEYGNLSAENPLRLGDRVVLDYRRHDGQRVVTMLVREETDETREPSNVPASPTPYDPFGSL